MDSDLCSIVNPAVIERSRRYGKPARDSSEKVSNSSERWFPKEAPTESLGGSKLGPRRDS